MDKNKLSFKFYIPSNLGLVNIYKIVVIDKVQRKIIPNKTTAKKVSHIVVDFLNRNGESILTSPYLDKNVFAI